jgi:hypothetical protein
VPCPDVACWICTTKPSGGKTATASSWADVQVLQPTEGLQEDCVHLFTLSVVSNVGILINVFFLPSYFQSFTFHCVNINVAVVR